MKKPLYQSTRFNLYREKINKLEQKDLIYACSCSRKEIVEKAQNSILGKRYPETCRNKKLSLSNPNFNLRLKSFDFSIEFYDRVFGNQTCNINKQIGDFVVYRKYDLPTYALAVTVDDAEQGVTEVVRGHDLLAFTPLQIYLCKILNIPIPSFLHIPLILNKDGKKLSKQTMANSLSLENISDTIIQALLDLGQNAPKALSQENLNTIWAWAIENWDFKKIPATRGLHYYNET